MKNGINVDQRNRNDCSRHGASSHSSRTWNWRRRKKREEEAKRRLQVKRRQKVKDWLKRRVKLGHNRTLLHELEEEDFASFKNYLWRKLTLNQRPGVHSAAYGTVHCKEPLKSFEIRVGHSPGFGLPSVAILPWLCRKRRKAIFIYIQELPQFELPHTIRTVRIQFTDFLRIDSGRRFVEIRLLLDRGLDATHSDVNVSHMYAMLYRGGDFAWARYP